MAVARWTEGNVGEQRTQAEIAAIRFGRSTTEKRFIAVFGAVIVVFVAASFIAMQSVAGIHEMMHQAVARSLRLSSLRKLESASRQFYAHQAHIIIMGDTEHMDRYVATRGELDGLIEEVAGSTEDAVEHERLRRAAAFFREADEMFRLRIVPQVEAGNLVAARHAHGELLRLHERAELLLQELSLSVEQRVLRFDDHASVIAHGGFRNTVLLLIGAAIFTAIVGLYLARSVARPVALIEHGAARMAEGDLETRIRIERPPEFRKLARQFNQMVVATKLHQQRAVDAERLAGIGRLAAGVAHEINNPLGVIQGYVRLLKGRADSELMEDLEIIDEECARCSEIVRGLLDMARPPVGDLAEVDLRDLVEETVDRVARSERHADAHIEISGYARAWCDSRTTRQVLLNLIENASDAAGDGGRVAITLSEDSSRGFELRVADSGSGLPTDRSRLFEPFFTTKDAGTGLGLAVSRAIARAHGGDIVASNGIDTGAVFTFTIPAHNSNISAHGSTPRAQRKSPAHQEGNT